MLSTNMKSDAHQLTTAEARADDVRLQPLSCRERRHQWNGLAQARRGAKKSAAAKRHNNDDRDNEPARKRSRTTWNWIGMHEERSPFAVENMSNFPPSWQLSLSLLEHQGLFSTRNEEVSEARTPENTMFAAVAAVTLEDILAQDNDTPSLRLGESEEDTDGTSSDEDFGGDEPFRIVG